MADVTYTLTLCGDIVVREPNLEKEKEMSRTDKDIPSRVKIEQMARRGDLRVEHSHGKDEPCPLDHMTSGAGVNSSRYGCFVPVSEFRRTNLTDGCDCHQDTNRSMGTRRQATLRRAADAYNSGAVDEFESLVEDYSMGSAPHDYHCPYRGH